MQANRLHTYSIVVLLVLVVLFGLYNFRSLYLGPRITVENIRPYDRVGAVVEVHGHIEKPKEARINNAILLVTPEGDFVTNVYLTPPEDSIDIWSINMYGKEETLHIPLIVTE